MNATTLRLDTVRQWAPFGIGAAAVLGIYAPVVPAMVAEWAAFPSLSHGFAIPLIAAYLVWGRRAQIAKEAVASMREVLFRRPAESALVRIAMSMRPTEAMEDSLRVASEIAPRLYGAVASALAPDAAPLREPNAPPGGPRP